MILEGLSVDPNYPTSSTPQNTPANNAPISSHAQQPGVASISEGKLIPLSSLLVSFGLSLANP